MNDPIHPASYETLRQLMKLHGKYKVQDAVNAIGKELDAEEAAYRRSRWLIDAGALEEGATLTVYPCADITAKIAFEALKAQYGAGLYDTYQHGQSLHVRKGRRFKDGQFRRDATDANEAYWAARRSGASVEEVEALRVKHRQLRDAEDAIPLHDDHNIVKT